ncbi:unnamed protein product [Bursaphelenchus okinawaensis]|uniref:Uncharacterized protein n=1 Tax=Bursaphelenchus okinawaensis TaxID=465554 RepID=A0A811JRT0_9BILA|nr:unnamed protein product [Bursaphelenchus okinawaensis]CAG9079643.1 unnamed protein product [Bursaphelenchus okinawaensis]
MAEELLDDVNDYDYDDPEGMEFESQAESILHSDDENEAPAYPSYALRSSATKMRAPMTPIKEKDESKFSSVYLKNPLRERVANSRRDLTDAFKNISFANKNDPEVKAKKERDRRAWAGSYDDVDVDDRDKTLARAGLDTMEEQVKAYENRFNHKFSEVQEEPKRSVRFDEVVQENPTSVAFTSVAESVHSVRQNSFSDEAPVERFDLRRADSEDSIGNRSYEEDRRISEADDDRQRVLDFEENCGANEAVKRDPDVRRNVRNTDIDLASKTRENEVKVQKNDSLLHKMNPPVPQNESRLQRWRRERKQELDQIRSQRDEALQKSQTRSSLAPRIAQSPNPKSSGRSLPMDVVQPSLINQHLNTGVFKVPLSRADVLFTPKRPGHRSLSGNLNFSTNSHGNLSARTDGSGASCGYGNGTQGLRNGSAYVDVASGTHGYGSANAHHNASSRNQAYCNNKMSAPDYGTGNQTTQGYGNNNLNARSYGMENQHAQTYGNTSRNVTNLGNLSTHGQADVTSGNRYIEKTEDTQSQKSAKTSSSGRSAPNTMCTMRTAIETADNSFQSRAPSTMSQVSAEITANTQQLAFGFVDVDQEKVLEVALTNRSFRTLEFKVSIKYPTDYKLGWVFKVLSLSTTSIEPGGTTKFSVLFKPRNVAVYNAEIIVTGTNLCETVYKIPCYGYGGRAMLEALTSAGERLLAGPEGLRVLTIDSRANSFTFALKNTGERTAFCAIMPKNEHDDFCEPNHVVITPQRVIIQKNKMQVFTVKLTADLRRSVSAQSLSSVRTVSDGALKLWVYYGEERQRMRLRKYVRQQKRGYTCFKMNFAVDFEGQYDREIKLVHRADLEAFRNCIRTFQIQFSDPRRTVQKALMNSRPGTAMTFDNTLEQSVQSTTFAEQLHSFAATPLAKSRAFTPGNNDTMMP